MDNELFGARRPLTSRRLDLLKSGLNDILREHIPTDEYMCNAPAHIPLVLPE